MIGWETYQTYGDQHCTASTASPSSDIYLPYQPGPDDNVGKSASVQSIND
jgi:hypothetical protein